MRSKTLFSRWNGDCICHRPTSTQTLANQGIARPDASRPLRCGQCFAVVCQENVRAKVATLLGMGCPATVFRAVIFTTIDAIQRAAAWPLSHIRKEVLKRFNPPVTDSDASCSVVFEVWVFWVKAPLLHAIPALVCSGSAHLVRSVQQHAAARPDCATGKRVSAHGFGVTAVADADPRNLSAHRLIGHAQCCKPPIANTGSVKELCHFFTLKLLTVKDAWQSAVRQFFGSYPSQAIVILPRIAT